MPIFAWKLTDMKKRIQGGVPTTDVIVSAYVDNNDVVFRDIMNLYVPEKSIVADVTFGQGVFWNKIDLSKYTIKASDLYLKSEIRNRYQPLEIGDGIDCKNLPYENCSIDALVLDPPYMEGFYRRESSHIGGIGTHSSFRNAYTSGNGDEGGLRSKYITVR